jgi:hypothetical protein
MVELIFLIYVVPKRMTRLARERGRSALGWSLLADGAWVGAEIVIAVIFRIVYAFGESALGWSPKPPAGVVLLVYLTSLAAAVLSAEFVRRILSSLNRTGDYSLPPPPRF